MYILIEIVLVYTLRAWKHKKYEYKRAFEAWTSSVYLCIIGFSQNNGIFLLYAVKTLEYSMKMGSYYSDYHTVSERYSLMQFRCLDFGQGGHSHRPLLYEFWPLTFFIPFSSMFLSGTECPARTGTKIQEAHDPSFMMPMWVNLEISPWKSQRRKVRFNQTLKWNDPAAVTFPTLYVWFTNSPHLVLINTLTHRCIYIVSG